MASGADIATVGPGAVIGPMVGIVATSVGGQPVGVDVTPGSGAVTEVAEELAPMADGSVAPPGRVVGDVTAVVGGGATSRANAAPKALRPAVRSPGTIHRTRQAPRCRPGRQTAGAQDQTQPLRIVD